MKPSFPLLADIFQARTGSGLLFVVSGPSGVGKTQLCYYIMKALPKLTYSISFTTREARIHENNEKDYFFIPYQEFQEKIKRGEFLEWADVHGNLYGSSKESIQQSLQQGWDVILDIDVQGARQLAEKQSLESILVFILPPSLEQLKARLRNRGTNSPQDIATRLKNARDEITHYREYHYLVVNDDFQQAANELKAIIIAERCRLRKTDRR